MWLGACEFLEVITARFSAEWRMLVLGGVGRDGVLRSTELVDPVAFETRLGPQLIVPRYGASGTVTADGMVVVAGGASVMADGGSILRATEAMTSASWRAWRGLPAEPFQMSRDSGGMLLGAGARLYGLPAAVRRWLPGGQRAARAHRFREFARPVAGSFPRDSPGRTIGLSRKFGSGCRMSAPRNPWSLPSAVWLADSVTAVGRATGKEDQTPLGK